MSCRISQLAFSMTRCLYSFFLGGNAIYIMKEGFRSWWCCFRCMVITVTRAHLSSSLMANFLAPSGPASNYLDEIG